MGTVTYKSTPAQDQSTPTDKSELEMKLLQVAPEPKRTRDAIDEVISKLNSCLPNNGRTGAIITRKHESIYQGEWKVFTAQLSTLCKDCLELATCPLGLSLSLPPLLSFAFSLFSLCAHALALFLFPSPHFLSPHGNSSGLLGPWGQ